MTEVFELPQYWKDIYTVFQHVAIILVPFFFILSMGIFALQAFDGMKLESKMLNLVLAVILIMMWPEIVTGIKDLVDGFNYFLMKDFFHLDPQHSLLSPSALTVISDTILYPSDWSWTNIPHDLKLVFDFFINFGLVIVMLVPKLIIYYLYLVFYFFYLALGPLVIARGVMSEELSVTFDLLQEIVVLMLWQTCYVIMVGLVNHIAGVTPHMTLSQVGYWTLISTSIGLAVLTFAIPTITRKFALQIGGAFVPHGFKMGGALLGISALAGIFKIPARAMGPVVGGEAAAEGGIIEVFKAGAEHAHTFMEIAHLQHKARHAEHEAESHAEALHHAAVHGEHEDHPPDGAHEVHHDEEHHHSELHQELFHAGEEAGHAEHAMGEAIHEIEETEVSDHLFPSHSGSAHSEPLMKSARTATAPSSKNPLKDFFFRKPQIIKKSSVVGDEMKDERTAMLRRVLRLARGPVDSDKFEDMKVLGIAHDAIEANDLITLERYMSALDRFNARYGHLYNYEGKYVGADGKRPRTWKDTPEGGLDT